MEKCLTIVGRSKSAKRFTGMFAEPLLDILKEENFDIQEVECLGDYSELDESHRFIAFVVVHDDADKNLKLERLFSDLIDLQLGVRLFENIDDAKSYAEEHYDYGSDEEEVDDEDTDETEEDEEGFPHFTAEEIEDFFTFESLFKTNRLGTIRGRVYGEPVTVMAHIVHGPDAVRITPYALMVNEDMLENMELPEINERD